MKRDYLRVNFLVLWASLSIVKFLLAWRLPLFVDEAFYVWESRHLAWAYSDLPGLTAWLIRAGTTLGGQAELAVRLPFLLIGASLPWWVVRLAARWFEGSAVSNYALSPASWKQLVALAHAR